MHFGRYQASSAALGWPGVWVLHIMHAHTHTHTHTHVVSLRKWTHVMNNAYTYFNHKLYKPQHHLGCNTCTCMSIIRKWGLLSFPVIKPQLQLRVCPTWPCTCTWWIHANLVWDNTQHPPPIPHAHASRLGTGNQQKNHFSPQVSDSSPSQAIQQDSVTRPGIGQNASYALGDCLISRPEGCSRNLRSCSSQFNVHVCT